MILFNFKYHGLELSSQLCCTFFSKHHNLSRLTPVPSFSWNNQTYTFVFVEIMQGTCLLGTIQAVVCANKNLFAFSFALYLNSSSTNNKTILGRKTAFAFAVAFALCVYGPWGRANVGRIHWWDLRMLLMYLSFCRNMEPMHITVKLQKFPTISALCFCSCDKVNHNQEVRFRLYLLGQIVTWQSKP